MAFDLTNPDVLANSFWFVMTTYIIALGFQLYMMYLNIKQSKVNNQMAELLNEVKEINNKLKNKK